MSRLLSGLGHEVIVAHARNVRLIGESRCKDDRLDAQTLARLARIDPQFHATILTFRVFRTKLPLPINSCLLTEIILSASLTAPRPRDPAERAASPKAMLTENLSPLHGGDVCLLIMSACVSWFSSFCWDV